MFLNGNIEHIPIEVPALSTKQALQAVPRRFSNPKAPFLRAMRGLRAKRAWTPVTMSTQGTRGLRAKRALGSD